MTKHTLWITIIIALLLLSGCNTENDGIFMRISKSETKKDVGTITLIAKTGSTTTPTLYTQTKQHQLQVYSTAIKDWTNLAPDKRATHVATDGANIYFAPSVTEGENNSIFQYVIGNNFADPLAKYANKYMIVAMSPTADLMVVKNSSNKFDVYKISTEVKLISDLSFFETNTPQLIAQDDTHFIVSGKDTKDTYKHILSNGTTLKYKGAETNLYDYPVVAFHDNGTNIVLLTSNGATWYDEGTGLTFTKKGTVTNFSPGTPSNRPYPVFFYDDGTPKLYLQDNNQDLRSISLSDGTVALESSVDMPAVKAWSFLVDPSDSDIIYMGTTQNGIFKINMLTKTVTSL